jgi:hypothetical protein
VEASPPSTGQQQQKKKWRRLEMMVMVESLVVLAEGDCFLFR